MLYLWNCFVNYPHVFWLLSDCVCRTRLFSWPLGIRCNISWFPMRLPSSTACLCYASQETLTLEPLCIVALRFFRMLIPELTSIGFKPCPANSASLQNSLKKKKALEGWDVEWRRETFRRLNNNWLFRFWLIVGRYKNQLESLGNNTKLVKDLIPEHVSAWSGN